MKRINKDFDEKYKHPTDQWMKLTGTQQEVMIAKAETFLGVSQKFKKLLAQYPDDPGEVLHDLAMYIDKETDDLLKSVGVDPKDLK